METNNPPTKGGVREIPVMHVSQPSAPAQVPVITTNAPPAGWTPQVSSQSGPTQVPVQNIGQNLSQPEAVSADNKDRAPSPLPGNLPPIQQISTIKAEADKLQSQVEKFTNVEGSKEYTYLEEMLTRLLIKLDLIETQGIDEIRQARKKAVNAIQMTLSQLELKAMANAAPIANDSTAIPPNMNLQTDKKETFDNNPSDVSMQVDYNNKC